MAKKKKPTTRRTSKKRTKAKTKLGAFNFLSRSNGYLRFSGTAHKKPKRVTTKAKTISIVAFCLAFAVLGVVLLRASHAASNPRDEAVQYYDINHTRAGVGKGALQISVCLRDQARVWSLAMANSNSLHHPTIDQLKATATACAPGWSNVGQNIGYATLCSDNSNGPGSCTQRIYNAFVSPAEITSCLNGSDNQDHYCNITGDWTYVGVGSYRDGAGTLWITQDFVRCPGCAQTTYKPVYWTLNGGATVSSAASSRAVSINVHAGDNITWYHDIKNEGPVTATYPEHVDSYHYSPSGALLSSAQSDIGTQTTVGGTVYVWTKNATIPATARIGEKFCHLIWYGNASGPGTAADASNRTCATVH